MAHAVLVPGLNFYITATFTNGCGPSQGSQTKRKEEKKAVRDMSPASQQEMTRIYAREEFRDWKLSIIVVVVGFFEKLAEEYFQVANDHSEGRR